MAKLDDIPKTYEQAVETLARWHAEGQDVPIEIFAYDDPQKRTVRLVEVSDAFPESGTVVAVPMGSSCDFPFPSAVVLVTPNEWDKIKRGELILPSGFNGAGERCVWPR